MASLLARFSSFLLIVLFLHEKYQSFCELPNVNDGAPQLTQVVKQETSNGG